MKHLFILLTFFLSVTSFGQKLSPSSKTAVIRFQIVDPKGKALPNEEVCLKAKMTKKIVCGTSDEEGFADLLVPLNDLYLIGLKYQPQYGTLPIGPAPNQTYTYQIEYDHLAYLSTLNFYLKTSSGKPLSEKVTLKSMKDEKEYSFTTDKKGYAQVKIPYNDKYIVSYPSAPDFDLVEIPKVLSYTQNFKATYDGSGTGKIYPNLYNALFALRYLNLKGEVVPGEHFYLKGSKSDSIYEGVTNEKGIAHILVPIGDVYSFSIDLRKDFHKRQVKAVIGKYDYKIDVTYISSKEYKKRQELRKLAEAAREAEWERIKKEYESGKTASFDLTSSYYADTIINAVFNRNKHWKDKLIILDVTGSMTPYTNQVRKWYELNYAEKDPIQFVLFNDGDGKPNRLKKIGETGGFHYCKYCSRPVFKDKLRFARKAGGGGDGPENDIEAILAGLTNTSNYTDVVLVADNYSDVKDIELLKKVKTPIKVIVCGSTGTVHPHYLELAYATGGSVHTIEEDLTNIAETIEGGKIRIGKFYYIMKYGKFFRVKADE